MEGINIIAALLVLGIFISSYPHGAAIAQDNTSSVDPSQPGEEAATHIETRYEGWSIAYRLVIILAIAGGFVGLLVWKQKQHQS